MAGLLARSFLAPSQAWMGFLNREIVAYNFLIFQSPLTQWFLPKKSMELTAAGTAPVLHRIPFSDFRLCRESP
jgi:hypothetical protein